MLNVDKNEIIVDVGKVNNQVYYISQLSLTRKVISPNGEPITIMPQHADFMPFISCIDSFYSNSETLKINYSFIKNSFIRYPEFFQFYYEYFEQLYLMTEQFRTKQLSLGKKKYMSWLYLNHPDFFQIFSSKDLASFIGVTPEWFSKLKRKFLS